MEFLKSQLEIRFANDLDKKVLDRILCKLIVSASPKETPKKL